MAEIQHAIDEEREAAHGSSYKALLKNGPQKFFYRTMLGIGGQFMQQLSYVILWLPSLPSLDSVTGSEGTGLVQSLSAIAIQGHQFDYVLCPCHL